MSTTKEIGDAMTTMLREMIANEPTSVLRKDLKTYDRDAKRAELPAWGRENARTLAREIRAELERRGDG